MDSVKQKLENPNKLTLKQFNRQLKATTPSLTASFPFHPTITTKIKKSLASHDVKVTSSSGTTLRDLLTKTKTTPPPHLTPNVIYEISCNDCTATYIKNKLLLKSMDLSIFFVGNKIIVFRTKQCIFEILNIHPRSLTRKN